MEFDRQQSEANSFMDYSQGPSNVDIRDVYNTNVGASKGILTGHSDLLTQYQRDEVSRRAAQDYAQDSHPAQGRLLVGEADAQPIENAGDAEQYLGQSATTQVVGSSQANYGQPQRVDAYGYESGVDPAILNAQVIAHNNQVNSSLGLNSYQVQTDQYGNNVQYGATNEGQTYQVATDDVNANQNLQGQTYDLSQPQEQQDLQDQQQEQQDENNVQQNLQTNDQNLQQVIADNQGTYNTNTGINPAESQVVVKNNVDPQNPPVDNVAQQEVVASNVGGQSALTTKGSFIFTPLEFKFSGENKDKNPKVKPLFKAKIGTNKGKSHVGKFENDSYLWNEQVSVNYSNQDDAILSVKKSGFLGKTIASGKISLGPMISQAKQEYTAPLMDKEKVVGEVRFEVEFKPKTK